jgi:ABC-2 type transport system permease protein
VPVISMRLIVEERNLGTLEMLFTSPLTEWQVAIGKFLGAWGFLCVMLAVTAYMPFFATRNGSIDTGPMWGGYIALACACAAFAAFGLLCSSLTASQVVAGFLAFGGMVFSWMLAGGQALRDSDVAAFVSQWSVFFHCQRMLEGAVDTKDVVFFLSVTVFCLFATVSVLESRKWS